jgi:hypothetical protein
MASGSALHRLRRETQDPDTPSRPGLPHPMKSPFLSALALWAALLAGHAAAEPAVIRPGALWPDNQGRHIQAHGGGLLLLGDTYFWFGEDRTPGLDPTRRYVACYASTDLAHWTFRHRVLALGDPDHLGPTRIVERPKVYHNPRTGKFVMYFHADGPVPGLPGDYSLARVGVATCDTVDGDYLFLRSFRPLGHESRDIGQFVDDDGTAYLIFEDRPYGFRIARLSADYLAVEREVCLVPAHLEGGAIVHLDGLYYVVGSRLTGWNANPNQYAVATALAGPWSEFRDVAPPAANTYGAQSGTLLKVVGSQGTVVVFAGDIWKPADLSDSRYLWMPLAIGHGQLSLPPPAPWVIDIGHGLARTAD